VESEAKKFEVLNTYREKAREYRKLLSMGTLRATEFNIRDFIDKYCKFLITSYSDLSERLQINLECPGKVSLAEYLNSLFDYPERDCEYDFRVFEILIDKINEKNYNHRMLSIRETLNIFRAIVKKKKIEPKPNGKGKESVRFKINGVGECGSVRSVLLALRIGGIKDIEALKLTHYKGLIPLFNVPDGLVSEHGYAGPVYSFARFQEGKIAIDLKLTEILEPIIEGEWKGFYKDAEGGHWGPFTLIRAKFKLGDSRTNSVIQILEVLNDGKKKEIFTLGKIRKIVVAYPVRQEWIENLKLKNLLKS